MFLAKKVGDFIKKESECLEIAGLEIPRDYSIRTEVFYIYGFRCYGTKAQGMDAYFLGTG